MKTKNVLAAVLLCAVPLAGLAAPPAKTARKEKKMPAAPRDYANTLATLQTDMGDITIKFLYDKAPRHVENFVDLASKGFYDGTMFHRVVPGFVIQGGDPYTKKPEDAAHRYGTGGNGNVKLKAEFSDIKHKRGTVSMARSQDPDSASSQFFICVADSPNLDGQYSAFGEVVTGMEVADKIVNVPRNANDRPNQPVHIKKILLTQAKG